MAMQPALETFEDEYDSEERSDYDDEDFDDDEDEGYRTTPLRYSSACPELPTNRPADYPHLIQAGSFAEETDSTNLRAADGIATLLWNWNPAEFRAFFDLSTPKYELSRIASVGPIKEMLIARFGRGVLAGFRIDDGYGDKMWDPQLTFVIEEDGKWSPQSSSKGNQPDTVEFFGMMFSKQILYHKLWSEGDGVTFTTYL